MNNSFPRLIDGMCTTLREEVLPRLDDEFARGQVFGVINLLNTFRARADWSAGFLLAQIAAQQQALDSVAALLLRSTGAETEALAALHSFTLVGEVARPRGGAKELGAGGWDSRTSQLVSDSKISTAGIPPTPNPSPRHGEAMLRMDGGGEPPQFSQFTIADLLALRDRGNRAIGDLLGWLDGARGQLPPETATAIDGLLAKAMRAEVDIELKNSPRPLFAEMSSGREG